MKHLCSFALLYLIFIICVDAIDRLIFMILFNFAKKYLRYSIFFLFQRSRRDVVRAKSYRRSRRYAQADKNVDGLRDRIHRAQNARAHSLIDNLGCDTAARQIFEENWLAQDAQKTKNFVKHKASRKAPRQFPRTHRRCPPRYKLYQRMTHDNEAFLKNDDVAAKEKFIPSR